MGIQSSRQRPRRQRVRPHVPFHIWTTLSRRLVGTHRFSPVLDLALSPCECKYLLPAMTGAGRCEPRVLGAGGRRRGHFGPARNASPPGQSAHGPIKVEKHDFKHVLLNLNRAASNLPLWRAQPRPLPRTPAGTPPRALKSAEQLPARRFPRAFGAGWPESRSDNSRSGSENCADSSQSQRRVTDSA